MATFEDTLLYSLSIDIQSFLKNSEEALRKVKGLDDQFQKSFGADYGRRLGQSIDPKNIPQIEKTRAALTSLGPDAQKSFERSLGRQASKALFDPLLNEAQTFSGKIKASLRDSFSIQKIALGTVAGFGITALLSGLANVSTALIRIAGDAAETRSKFNEIFGGLASDTRQFANEFADSVGRARIDIEDFLASFQTILEPLGFADTQAAEFSKSLVALATDVASFNNKLDADVIRDFQSALVGESEPVKKYGIIVNETRVKQEALNLGIIKTGEELTETGKVFVRYQVLLKDTAAAQGDAVRTADSFNNQTKRLQGNLKNLADDIGSFFLPAMQVATNQLNNFLEALSGIGDISFDTTGLREFASEVQAVFGGGLAFQQISAGEAERARRQREEAERLKAINKQLDDFFVGVENVNKGFVKQKDVAEKSFRAVGIELAKIIKSFKELSAEERKLFAGIETPRDLSKSLEEFNKQLKIKLEPIVQVEFTPENIGFRGIENIVLELRGALNDIADPIVTFTERLAELGIATEDELVQLADILDRNLGDLVASILNFASAVGPGGTLLGGILGGVGLISSAIGALSSLFGRDSSAEARRQLEAERQQAIASERAQEAARKAAEALEQLRDAAERFSAQEFADEITKLNEEFRNLTAGSRDLTLEEQRRAIELRTQLELIRNNIEALERERDVTTDPERLREIQEELRLLNEQFDVADAALRDLGISLSNVTAAELERLRAILQERGVLEDAIAAFGAFGDDLDGLIDKLNLTFNLKGVIDNAEKLRQLIAGLVEQFQFAVPEDLPQFIQDGLAALTQGGQALIDFLTAAGLEELTAEEFARLLELLNDFSKQADDTTDEIVDVFGDLIHRLNLEFDLFDVDEPIDKIRRLIEEMHTQFGFILPLGTTLEDFVQQGFDALKTGGDDLKAFLAQIGLEELTAEQLEEFLRMLEGFGDEIGETTTEIGDAFAELIDKLQLEFNLFDISDPIAQLKRFQQEIIKRFGAIIPDTQEGINALIQQGFDALLAGGDALKTFLASINLEELTADQFRNFLEFLEGLADEVQAKADEVVDESERIGISAVKSITFQQANVLINEVATIREVVTQILGEMRGIPSPGGGGSPNPPPVDDDFIKVWFENFDERIRDKEILSELTLLRESFDDYSGDVTTPIIAEAQDIAALLRVTPGSFGRLTGSIVDLEQATTRDAAITHQLLREIDVQIEQSILALANAVNASASISAFANVSGGAGAASERFAQSGAGALFGLNLIGEGMSRAFAVMAAEFDRLSAQNAIILSSIGNVSANASVSIYIVHSDGTISEISPSQLEESDRKLAEKILTMSRGRGA